MSLGVTTDRLQIAGYILTGTATVLFARDTYIMMWNYMDTIINLSGIGHAACYGFLPSLQWSSQPSLSPLGWYTVHLTFFLHIVSN